MEDNMYKMFERIANALERQNQLLENKESRQMKIDKLDAEQRKIHLKESKSNKITSPRNKKV
jgi:hypothetical protein|tara:strand:+ start:25 stop:210 length:186 start_codon:yes stop_codon:yes gene_type:complete